MLFDLRSAGRRRTVKGVYLGLALLMFVGFVGFSVGSSGLSGGIVDAITGSNSGGGTDNSSQERLAAAVRTADAKAKAAPSNPDAWRDLAQARLRLSNVGDYFDSKASDYTAAGRRQLAAAGEAWDKYVALKPAKPDESTARQMIQAYIALGKPDKAVATQEVLTEVQPTQQTFQNLAILSYQAGNVRKGDLAAGRAVDLAPKDQKKDVKSQLDQVKQQALQQEIQQVQPTPTATIG
jgi:tetratricopeptide (TPR) repeat protein